MRVNKILLIAILFLTVTSLYAQRRMDPEKQIEKLTKELNLNEDQQTDILEILNNTQDEMEELMEEAGDDRSSVRDEMRELMQDANIKIEAELDEEQVTKYREYIEERKKNRKNRGNGQKKENKEK